jgi:hypothetical protein
MVRTGSAAIDVVIGLGFVFLLLSTVCSAANELLASVLSWRADYLERGVRSMLTGGHAASGHASLDEIFAQVADHPLIRSKTERGGGVRRLRRKRPFPSYLSARTFSLVLLDTLAPPLKASESTSHDVMGALSAKVDDLPVPLRDALRPLLTDARGDLDRFRRSLEDWFDDTMQRVGGWYKRKVQVVLLVIAAVVAIGFNADSVQIGRFLWHNDAVRSAVVAQATATVARPQAGTQADAANRVANTVADVRQLELPLGWTTKTADPRSAHTASQWFGKVAGLLVTILAIQLGAPFWFDMLGKVANLRGAGRPA